MPSTDPSIATWQAALAAGRLTRRQFIARGVALGLSAAAIAAALAACGGPAATPTAAPAAGATGAATTPLAAVSGTAGAARPAAPAAASAPASPAAGKRGGGGTLKILQWQAPTILNYHFGTGGKDNLASRIFYEPLVSADADGRFVLVLAERLPTRENGGLAADGTSATWALKSGLTWSDGEPVTAADVVFTWEYVTDPATAAVTVAEYTGVARVERVDDLTARFVFTDPNPAWFRPALLPLIPQHVFAADKGANARNSPHNLKPVGTGPYTVTQFTPGDLVTMTINEHYREPDKPFFDHVELKGGGDATSAARAVIQTGDYDYAWNLQVEDSILKQLEQGGKGVAGFQDGFGVEMITLNFTDPNKEDPATGERSSLKFPHPCFSDPQARQALALATDRQTIVTALYGRAGEVSTNVLNDPPAVRSQNTTAAFDPDKAGALLDAAGWRRGAGGARQKDGVALALTYATTVNSTRQKTQQIVKDGWGKAGIQVELKAVDAGVFFSSDPGNTDNYRHFYTDVEMSTASPTFDPLSYMSAYYGKNAPQKANGWSGNNLGRFQDPQFDQRYDAARAELDAQRRDTLFIEMNDIVVRDVAVVPLVNRKSVYARGKALRGVRPTPWDWDYWNIADWAK